MNRKPYRYAQVHVPYGQDAWLGRRSRAEQIVAGLLDDLVNRGPPADLVQPNAVEELLRYAPLAAGNPGAGGHARMATADIELDGVTVTTGEAVLPAINSANRDERVFAEPANASKRTPAELLAAW